jgi:ubiquinone/menaquinone biosynthesis C-methylase UbiE
MPKITSAATRHYGRVFDDIAYEYDKHRPGYPDELIDRACELAELKEGDPVLEVGCGSGQLTKALATRGFKVMALDPGEQLVALAKQNVQDAGAVEFTCARFEDAELPKEYYRAAFSASAFHWVDPNVGWSKIAELLAPGGTFALLQYFGLKEERTARDLTLLLAAMKRAAPEMAASWPKYYDMDQIINGVEKRHGNISEVWSWLGTYDLVRKQAGQLFGDVQMATAPMFVEQTPAEIDATIRTISFYSRLSEQERIALARECEAVYQKLGRPVRSSIVSILVTARRT